MATAKVRSAVTNTLLKGRDYALSGLIAVFAANIIWGISDVCIKIIGRGQLVTCILGFTGFIFLLLIALIRRDTISFKEFLYAFPLGFQRSIIWAGIFIAYQQDNPAIATTIYSFSLVVAIVFFGPLLGEKITARILIITLVGVLGVVLTASESLTNLKFSSGSIIVLLLLPLGAAGTFMLRKLQQNVPAETAPLYYFLWVGILMLPIALLSHPEFGFTRHDYFVIVVMAITGAGGHYLYSISQKSTTFQFNSIAGTLHSPSTAICAYLFIGSTLVWSQMVGMAIVIVVVAYISISTKKPDVQILEENVPVGP